MKVQQLSDKQLKQIQGGSDNQQRGITGNLKQCVFSLFRKC